MSYTYSKIASVTVGSGGVGSIDFLAIPQNYTDLVLKVSARSNRSPQSYETLYFSINGSNSNATFRELLGDGASTYSQSGTDPDFGQAPGNGGTANTFGNAEAYFPNYSGSTYKSYSADAVSENNATTAWSSLVAGLWSQSAPITSIRVRPGVGTLLLQYSTATLYGIKAEV
jgi:hypothetical protein